MSVRTAIVATVVAGLAACAAPSAGPTGYTTADAQRGASYGYRDKEIGDDEFSIVATGNRLTSRERVAEIALLRAARIAEARGRTHFLILNQKSARLQNTRTQNVVIFLPAFGGFPGTVAPIPVGEQTTLEPMTVLLIRLLPVEGGYPGDAVNAAQVIGRLSSKVRDAPPQ